MRFMAGTVRESRMVEHLSGRFFYAFRRFQRNRLDVFHVAWLSRPLFRLWLTAVVVCLLDQVTRLFGGQPFP